MKAGTHIPELFDFEATFADDAAGLALVHQHAKVGAFALALDARGLAHSTVGPRGLQAQHTP